MYFSSEHVQTLLDDPSNDEDAVSLSVTRKVRIALIHKCVELMIEEMECFRLTGCVIRTSDGMGLGMHPVIA